MAKQRKPKDVSNKGGILRSREGKGDHLVNITEETDQRTGKKVITVEKTKPGNSNN